jgi:hypothetical protein
VNSVIEDLRVNLAREEEELELIRLAIEMLGLESKRYVLENKQRRVENNRRLIAMQQEDSGGFAQSDKLVAGNRPWVKPGMFSASPKVAVRQYLEHRERIDRDTSPASIAYEIVPNLIAAAARKKSPTTGEAVDPSVGSVSSAIRWGDINGEKAKGKKWFRYKKTSGPGANDGWVQLKHWPPPPDWQGK